MVFSPEENFRDLSGFDSQKHPGGKKVSEKFAKKPPPAGWGEGTRPFKPP
jgi:hypothetical protein